MSTTGDVKVTEGSGKAVATYTITEDSETKSLQRVVICDPTGAEIGSIVSNNAANQAPSPVELGPFSAIYLTSGTNAAVQNTTAAVGDYLQHAILQPTTISPGAFTLYDGSTGGTNSVKYTHPGGASSLSNLAPIIVGFSAKCVNAGWHITIVSGWTVTLVGTFT